MTTLKKYLEPWNLLKGMIVYKSTFESGRETSAVAYWQPVITIEGYIKDFRLDANRHLQKRLRPGVLIHVNVFLPIKADMLLSQTIFQFAIFILSNILFVMRSNICKITTWETWQMVTRHSVRWRTYNAANLTSHTLITRCGIWLISTFGKNF